jgi:hypothetical protein
VANFLLVCFFEEIFVASSGFAGVKANLSNTANALQSKWHSNLENFYRNFFVVGADERDSDHG